MYRYFEVVVLVACTQIPKSTDGNFPTPADRRSSSPHPDDKIPFTMLTSTSTGKFRDATCKIQDTPEYFECDMR